MAGKIPFESLGDLLIGVSPFRPFAQYEKNLDRIRVQIMDCSICEEPLHPFLTLFYANYPFGRDATPGDEQIVGFAIESVSQLFKILRLKPYGVIKLAELLDAMVERFPGTSARLALEVFGAWPDDTKPKEVEFPRAA
jgi:hypothetical protein